MTSAAIARRKMVNLTRTRFERETLVLLGIKIFSFVRCQATALHMKRYRTSTTVEYRNECPKSIEFVFFEWNVSCKMTPGCKRV